MRKKVFFMLLIALLAANGTVCGQELRPKTKGNLGWGFVDETGKVVIPFQFGMVLPFSEGLAAVKYNGGKCGFIDKTGEIVIPLKYVHAQSFSEGLAAVKLNGKWGYIDKTGKEVIPLKYDDAWGFSDDLALVKLNKKYGYIDKKGKIVIPIEYTEIEATTKKSQFSYFAKNFIENKVDEWQKKSEFESTTTWQQRVTEETRKEKASELLKEAENIFIYERSKNFPCGNITLGAYDADNEVYLIKSDKFGDWLVPVPLNEAQNFKNNWNNIKKTPKCIINNDQLALAVMDFTDTNGKTYHYNNQSSLNYTIANIDYNFAPIEINVPTTTQPTPQGNQNISTVNLNAGQSDVAVNIPKTTIKNDKTFAVIIANENYQREAPVEFAKNDGETFRKYCTQTLGLPEKNVHFVADATLNNIRGEINWLANVAAAFNSEATIIFYYAGHGIPDEATKSAYLLPIDGYGSDIETGYKLDDLYSKLGNMSAKNVILFMDACFSGAQRSGEMLASARGVAVRPKQGTLFGNMVVFSAAQGDETAYPYREKQHGMFTYFLLKKLQETKGDVTLGELSSFITTQVQQQSIVVNRKSQTPTVIHSTGLQNWENLKLK
jgi:hypothetical protein